MNLKGIVFDLDGTLVDSALDFKLMRAEMGIPKGEPILEYLGRLPEGQFKSRCWDIVTTHERRGALSASIIPGVHELLKKLKSYGLQLGIFTRNFLEPTQLVLDRLGITGFSQIMTRESAPPKPDPTALLEICKAWNSQGAEVLMIGDYLYDLEAGKRAGMKTVLYAPKEIPYFASQADHVVSDFVSFACEFETVATALNFNFPSALP